MDTCYFAGMDTTAHHYRYNPRGAVKVPPWGMGVMAITHLCIIPNNLVVHELPIEDHAKEVLKVLIMYVVKYGTMA